MDTFVKILAFLGPILSLFGAIWFSYGYDIIYYIMKLFV